jgi:hypothetical protein
MFPKVIIVLQIVLCIYQMWILFKTLSNVRKAKALANPPRAQNDEIVMNLVLHTAALALKKGQFVEFAPIQGSCGNIKLSGNSLPCFEYTVFDKAIMEFIRVRVEVAKPDRISFSCKIKPTDEKYEGAQVETKAQYMEPFWKLATHLNRYFPFPMDGGAIKNEHKRKPEEHNSTIQAKGRGAISL